MSFQCIAVDDVVPQAWRNGGGQTRELLPWPSQGSWRLRISRADIAVDGPFSAFPGVTRWFTVVQGAGVALTLNGVRQELHCDGEALRFDGALAPDCRLLNGPTQDLNLMATSGDTTMTRVVPDVAWNAHWQMRGLYTAVAGLWRSSKEQCLVPAHNLLWQAQATADSDWTFSPESSAAGNAWWLGFTP